MVKSLAKLLRNVSKAAYPRECARLKNKELFNLITERLETLGATYTKAHGNKNVFKNVRLIEEEKE